MSEVGAPHVVDPRSCGERTRLYGEENMERLWGDVVPVPAEVVAALAGGERVEGFGMSTRRATRPPPWLYLELGERRSANGRGPDPAR